MSGATRASLRENGTLGELVFCCPLFKYVVVLAKVLESKPQGELVG